MFAGNLETFWRQLQFEHEFCDVVLACADKQFATQKIILASYSSVFRNILKENQYSHPFIYLNNVKHKSLQILLDFMYQGEVSVSKEDYSDFLGLAQDLKIKGLINDGRVIDNLQFGHQTTESNAKIVKIDNNEKNIVNNFDAISPLSNCTENFEINGKDDYASLISEHFNTQMKTKHENLNAMYEAKKQFDLKLDTDIEKSYDCNPYENNLIKRDLLEKHKAASHQEKNYYAVHPRQCDQCDYKTAYKSNLKKHRLSVHAPGESEVPTYSCSQCTSKFKTIYNLKIHIQSVHEKITYACDQCAYKVTQKSHLRSHILSVHDGVSYPCDQCKFQAKNRSNLRIHNEAVHEGLRYPCDQCSYMAPHVGNLNQHKARIHDGVRYPCEQCNYKATNRFDLTKHTQALHEGIRYPCNQCDHKATQKQTLKIHIDIVHKGIRYPCDQCDYKATQKTNLKKHKVSVHGNAS